MKLERSCPNQHSLLVDAGGRTVLPAEQNQRYICIEVLNGTPHFEKSTSHVSLSSCLISRVRSHPSTPSTISPSPRIASPSPSSPRSTPHSHTLVSTLASTLTYSKHHPQQRLPMKKPRTSTRSRKPPPQTHTYQSSSPSPNASPPQSPPSRRRRSPSFTAPDPVPSSDQEQDQDEAASPPQPPSGRPKKKAPAAAAAGKPTPAGTYRDVESVTTDTQLKGYTGPYDRATRGQSLLTTWYGPDIENIRRLQALQRQWIPWTVLPPKYITPLEEDDQGPHNPSSAPLQQTRRAFRQEHRHPGSYVALHGDARTPYQQPRLGIRLVMGPPDAHTHEQHHEWTMYPGDTFSLTQSWLPYHEDASEEKLPMGWMLDAGGIVTGMDWCPRQDPDCTQLLALAVLPHTDQESYPYESEHQRPDFQRHGTVQVWAMNGVEMDGVLRPSPRAARLRRTICMDFGRINRVRWCPVSDATTRYMAVLCGDGRVCVVADHDQQGQPDGQNGQDGQQHDSIFGKFFFISSLVYMCVCLCVFNYASTSSCVLRGIGLRHVLTSNRVRRSTRSNAHASG